MVLSLVLSPVERERLLNRIQSYGEAQTADAFGLSRLALARAAAGMKMKPATAEQIRAMMAELGMLEGDV